MTDVPLGVVAVFGAATTMLDKLGFSSERIVERAGLPQYQHLEPHLKIQAFISTESMVLRHVRSVKKHSVQ